MFQAVANFLASALKWPENYGTQAAVNKLNLAKSSSASKTVVFCNTTVEFFITP